MADFRICKSLILMTLSVPRRHPKYSEAPPDLQPRRLSRYVDVWLRDENFELDDGTPVRSAFRADPHIQAWGLMWQKKSDERAKIVPVMVAAGGKSKSTTVGVQVLGIHVPHNRRYDIFLVIEELPLGKDTDTRLYGLLVDANKLDSALCTSVTERGFEIYENPEQTVEDIEKSWELLVDAQNESAVVGEDPPANITTSSKKRKSPMKPKRPKKTTIEKDEAGKKPELTLADAVNFGSDDKKRLTPELREEIRKLYDAEFSPLYIHHSENTMGMESWKNPDGQELHVHYDHLHRAEPGTMVYRGLVQDRVDRIAMQVEIVPDISLVRAQVIVLPLKGYANEKPIYFSSRPEKKDINASTHYYIIGGQHTVAAHKQVLSTKDHISDFKRGLLSKFSIIPVWCEESNFQKLLYLSRVLNQDVAGERTEQTFMQQLGNARVAWHKMNRPMPALCGRVHSSKFKVR